MNNINNLLRCEHCNEKGTSLWPSRWCIMHLFSWRNLVMLSPRRTAHWTLYSASTIRNTGPWHPDSIPWDTQQLVLINVRDNVCKLWGHSTNGNSILIIRICWYCSVITDKLSQPDHFSVGVKKELQRADPLWKSLQSLSWSRSSPV
jgi:hypothetical protein